MPTFRKTILPLADRGGVF